MSTGGEVANALVCKTSIRRFNPDPVLQPHLRPSKLAYAAAKSALISPFDSPAPAGCSRRGFQCWYAQATTSVLGPHTGAQKVKCRANCRWNVAVPSRPSSNCTRICAPSMGKLSGSPAWYGRQTSELSGKVGLEIVLITLECTKVLELARKPSGNSGHRS